MNADRDAAVERARRALALKRFGHDTRENKLGMMRLLVQLAHEEHELAHLCERARATRQRDAKAVCKRHASVAARLREVKQLVQFL